ncbi:MAG TPA: hypothetical protein P5528_06695, partial [Steroidobacteraceae bacterium]|nr:hypothetical protein [Steroidobacteraceae bacterium]
MKRPLQLHDGGYERAGAAVHAECGAQRQQMLGFDLRLSGGYRLQQFPAARFGVAMAHGHPVTAIWPHPPSQLVRESLDEPMPPPDCCGYGHTAVGSHTENN